MGQKPETRLVGRIRDALHARYPRAWILKIHGNAFQLPGVPDLLVLVDGRLIGLEVKFPAPRESLAHARDRATVTQRKVMSNMRRAGARTAVILTPEEALQEVEQLLTLPYPAK